MAHDMITVVTGTVVEEERDIPLARLCRACRIPVELVAAMVDEGILEPAAGRRRGHWRFSAASVRRARTALRLRRDFGLDLSGVALVLELLDRLEVLECRLRALEGPR